MRRFLTFIVLGPVAGLVGLTALSVANTMNIHVPVDLDIVARSFLFIASLALVGAMGVGLAAYLLDLLLIYLGIGWLVRMAIIGGGVFWFSLHVDGKVTPAGTIIAVMCGLIGVLCTWVSARKSAGDGAK